MMLVVSIVAIFLVTSVNGGNLTPNNLKFYMIWDRHENLLDCRPENERMDRGTKCCFDDNFDVTTCTGRDNEGNCFGDECNTNNCYENLYVNYTSAKYNCQINDMRLCNISELVQICGGVGCSLDQREIWSGTECHPKFWVVRSVDDSQKCKDPMNTTGGVRCYRALINNQNYCRVKPGNISGLNASYCYNKVYNYGEWDNLTIFDAVKICENDNRRLPHIINQKSTGVCHDSGCDSNQYYGWTWETCGYDLTLDPTQNPTMSPSVVTTVPTNIPSVSTDNPSNNPTKHPTEYPSNTPTIVPSRYTKHPSTNPTKHPTGTPSKSPTQVPSITPSDTPTEIPSISPTKVPTLVPSILPSNDPTIIPTQYPTLIPTKVPSNNPTVNPAYHPTLTPTISPFINPSDNPTIVPTYNPTLFPTFIPSILPSNSPSSNPTLTPSKTQTHNPSYFPSKSPSKIPTIYIKYLPSKYPSTNPSNYPTDTPTISPLASVQTGNTSDNPTGTKFSLPELILIFISASFILILIIYYLYRRENREASAKAPPKSPKVKKTISVQMSEVLGSKTDHDRVNSSTALSYQTSDLGIDTPTFVPKYEDEEKEIDILYRTNSATLLDALEITKTTPNNRAIASHVRDHIMNLNTVNEGGESNPVLDLNSNDLSYLDKIVYDPKSPTQRIVPKLFVKKFNNTIDPINFSEGEKEQKLDRNVKKWSVSDVLLWLNNSVGLSMYNSNFKMNDINGELLVILDENQLEKIGVKSLGHRYKILKNVKMLCQQNSIVTS